MRVSRVALPALCLSLLTAGVIAAPVHAAPPRPAAPTLTPTLAYEACPVGEQLPEGTQCATLTVPLDWQSPDDGRTTTIALRVKRSQQGDGALTFNPGGPSVSGIDFTATLYSKLPSEVRDRFDFVSWDPRGVGRSGPALVDCSSAAGVDLPATGPVDWQAFWEATLAEYAAASSACLSANPDAAPYLGTWQVVRDLEAMRIALGYSQWNYWGMSYGTRIGNAYARTFPASLRALIMDGSVMAGETSYRFGTTYPAGLEVTKQVYASVTGKSQAHKIDTILDYLNDHDDLEVSGKVLTRWDFAAYVRTLLYGQANYPALRNYVNALYAVVAPASSADKARALRAAGRAAALLPRVNEPSVTQTLINCADLHDRPTAEQLAAASIAVERQYGTTAPAVMGNSAACAGLPADMSPASPTGTTTVALANPPMFVLSTGDAATPWAWGRSMANTFAGSRTISYASTQHVSYLLTPSTCINARVTRYLLTLQRPRTDVSCRFAP